MITYRGYQAAISFDHEAEVFHGEVVGTRDVIFYAWLAAVVERAV